jgi:phage terminase large subunit
MILDIGELYPKQKEFCRATNKYICYGGSRGGGKSHVSRIKMCLLALNYPGIQILILRRTLKELRENHILQLQKLLKDIAVYKDSTKEFIFPNGSRIVLGYCDNERDVLQYQGQAYEVIVLEEATHFTEFQFQTLTESNRMSGNMKDDFVPRMYFTCNPGGVGHQWVKRLFIDKNYRGNEEPSDYLFIPSLVFENKYIMEHDPNYVRVLENLPEDRKQAMLYGNWDIFDGQFFPEFDRKVHVIEPFEIPEHWNKYIALDYGLDMFAVLFIAVDTKGKAYIYNEIHKSDLIVSEARQVLKSYMRKDRFKDIYAPPDLWNRNRDTGKSTMEMFLEGGIAFNKASNNREAGWLAVKEWIKKRKVRHEQTGEVKEETNLYIFSNCTNLIRCIPQLQHDDKNPNDVATEPHEITHITDALRYFCVSRTNPSKEIISKEKSFEDFFNVTETNRDYGEEIVVI